MKKLIGIACTIMLFAACMDINGSGRNDNSTVITTDSVEDSLITHEGYHDISSKIKMVVPVGNETFNKSVSHVLMSFIDGNETVDSTNLKAMARFYVEKKVNELKEDVFCDGTTDFCPPLSHDLEVSVLYENEKIVTLLTTQTIYLGGAHGSFLVEGISLDKKTGKVLNTNILAKDKLNEVKKEVSKGLKEYFNYDSDDIIADSPMKESDGTDKIVDLPVNGIYIDKDSVVFTYQQYEIAAYVYGLPTTSIALKDMKKNGWLEPEFAKTVE